MCRKQSFFLALDTKSFQLLYTRNLVWVYRKNDVGINLVFVVTCFHMYNVYEITDMMEIKISCYNHVNVLRKRAEKLTRFPNFIQYDVSLFMFTSSNFKAEYEERTTFLEVEI